MAVLCMLAPTLRTQGSIQVDVNLVNVAFSVRDAGGALVDGLSQDDFEVLEDSAPQKIAYFAKSTDVPLTLGLIVDASGSQDRFEMQHEHDLDAFLKSVLGPKDRAFLVGFGNYVRLVSDFSRSGNEMMRQWKLYSKNPQNFPELGPHESRDLGTAFYDSIFYSVENKLAKETGRRALLIFSDGEDNSSSHDMMTTIEEAQQTNVLLFSIRYTQKEHGKLTARNQYGIRVMERIAHETGGMHIDAQQTDPKTYFRQIAEELRTSYELGYYPATSAKDDTFHKIVVRVKKPGLTVRSRTGYFSRGQVVAPKD
ncbi:MAG: VWA domain-containing protein [Acidobacteria bacterium]|nr:VWA domain-containing protein [Acidobacteriota bacterium]